LQKRIAHPNPNLPNRLNYLTTEGAEDAEKEKREMNNSSSRAETGFLPVTPTNGTYQFSTLFPGLEILRFAQNDNITFQFVTPTKSKSSNTLKIFKIC